MKQIYKKLQRDDEHKQNGYFDAYQSESEAENRDDHVVFPSPRTTSTSGYQSSPIANTPPSFKRAQEEEEAKERRRVHGHGSEGSSEEDDDEESGDEPGNQNMGPPTPVVAKRTRSHLRKTRSKKTKYGLRGKPQKKQKVNVDDGFVWTK